MINVAEINTAEKLDELHLLWKSLWQRTRGATFFHSLDWLRAYCRHFGRDQKLKVLVVSMVGKPIGILPLVVRRTDSTFGPMRVLTYPLGQWGNCYGPIGPNSAATLVAAMRYLRDSRRDWDVFDLQHIDADELDRGRTRNAMRTAGLNCLSQTGLASAVVDLNLNWTEYWASRPVEMRRGFHHAERRLSQFGTLEHVRFRPLGFREGEPDPRWDLFDEFSGLGQASSRNVEFLRDLHAAAAHEGAVDLNLVHLGGRPIAAAYGYHQNGRVEVVSLSSATGHAEDARTALLAHMLRDGAHRGDSRYVFAPQLGSAADEWRTSESSAVRLTHFALTAPRAQLLRLEGCVRGWFAGIGRGTAAARQSAANRPAPIPTPAISC